MNTRSWLSIVNTGQTHTHTHTHMQSLWLCCCRCLGCYWLLSLNSDPAAYQSLHSSLVPHCVFFHSSGHQERMSHHRWSEAKPQCLYLNISVCSEKQCRGTEDKTRSTYPWISFQWSGLLKSFCLTQCLNQFHLSPSKPIHVSVVSLIYLRGYNWHVCGFNRCCTEVRTVWGD